MADPITTDIGTPLMFRGAAVSNSYPLQVATNSAADIAFPEQVAVVGTPTGHASWSMPVTVRLPLREALVNVLVEAYLSAVNEPWPREAALGSRVGLTFDYALPRDWSTLADSPHEDTLEWLASQPGLLREYEGEWVALAGRSVVAHAPMMDEAVSLARAAGVDDPLLVPVAPSMPVIM